MSEPDSEPRPGDPAWAASPAGARWRAANPPPLSNLGRLPARLTFADIGITLDRPPGDASPNLDATAARNTYTQGGARIYGSTGPTLHLAVLDDDRLVYLFHADHVAVRQHGGPAGAVRADRPGIVFCEAVGLLDATTGKWIKQVQWSR